MSIPYSNCFLILFLYNSSKYQYILVQTRVLIPNSYDTKKYQFTFKLILITNSRKNDSLFQFNAMFQIKTHLQILLYIVVCIHISTSQSTYPILIHISSFIIPAHTHVNHRHFTQQLASYTNNNIYEPFNFSIL